jgi:inhibitor of KinA sporulation pathway (predicted exonuclease)
MRPTLYFASRKPRAWNLKRNIFARLQQLSDAREGDTERQAIDDAINLLKILKLTA